MCRTWIWVQIEQVYDTLIWSETWYSSRLTSHLSSRHANYLNRAIGSFAIESADKPTHSISSQVPNELLSSSSDPNHPAAREWITSSTALMQSFMICCAQITVSDPWISKYQDDQLISLVMFQRWKCSRLSATLLSRNDSFPSCN